MTNANAHDTTGYQGASLDAVQRHYDLSNEFFALWLDPTRTYSCALWGEGDSLEEAQLRKLDFLARHIAEGPAARVLDVGCGWGSMMRRLVDHHGVETVTGLTLSAAQAAYVDGLGEDGLSVRVENWADHEPDGGYDGIVSIGAFEHFAVPKLSRAERVAQYRSFFAKCHEWLPLGGPLALQTIVKGNNFLLDREMRREMLFVMDRIFNESELPRLSEIIEASELLFEVTTVRNDAEDYARTCGVWQETLRAREAEAVALVGEETFAEYDRYLSASVRAFSRLHTGLIRIHFRRT